MRRKFSLLFISLCLGMAGMTQLNITTFVVKKNLPAEVTSWAKDPSSVLLVANKTPFQKLSMTKLVVLIKRDGVAVCGYQPTEIKARDSSFTLNTFSAKELVGLLPRCEILSPGTYQLCVQFFDEGNKAVSKESCKEFTVEDNVTTPAPAISGSLKNIAPANGKSFSKEEAGQLILFRWTPVTPKSKEDIIYKIQVWQTSKDTRLLELIKTQLPVLQKEVRGETLSLSIGELAGSPGFRQAFDALLRKAETVTGNLLSHFTWNVTATGTSGTNYGSSEPTAFSVASPCSPDYEFIKDSVYCGPDGKVHVKGHVRIIPKPTITINQVALTEIKESNYSGANVPTSITVFPKVLPASGNNYFFDFIINSDMCNKDLYIGYAINFSCTVTGQTLTLPCGDIIKNIPCCNCTFCDQYKEWRTREETITANNSAPFIINLSTSFISPSLSIISFKAELVSIIHDGKEECFGCNKDQQTFGNFTGGTFGSWGSGVFPLSGSTTTHHTLSWFGLPGSSINLNGTALNVSFTVPPFSSLSCCDDEIRFCIRYSFTDKECRTCSFVKCYSVKRKH